MQYDTAIDLQHTKPNKPISTNITPEKLLNAETKSFDKILEEYTTNQTTTDSKFGLADLIDIVNPLHHIPVVGSVYRAISGDEIQVPAKILGGAAYGGPLGATSAIASAVLEQETGNSLVGHAINAASFKNQPVENQNNPETALNLAYNTQQDDDFARTLLSFADLSQNNDITIKTKSEINTDTILDAASKEWPSFYIKKTHEYNQ